MKNKSRLALLIACLAMVLAFSMVFAYFSDRATGVASIKTVDNAVDIDITKPDDTPEPDPDNPTDPDEPNGYTDPTPNDDTDDLTNWWNALNATAVANFNPGDKLCLDAKIINSGSLVIDYRQTIVVTSSEPMDRTAPEFRLFSNCVREKYGALTGKNVVLSENISSDGKKIVYTIAPATLGVNESITPNYDLVFDKSSSNDFQSAKVTVDYLVEARQANEAGADQDWTTVATASLSVGGENMSVVPKADNK